MGTFRFDSPYDQKRESKPVRIAPRWDRLTKDSVAAMNAGMSYGKYKAKLEEERKRGGREEAEGQHEAVPVLRGTDGGRL
mgnify:CR=1 FL=1